MKKNREIVKLMNMCRIYDKKTNKVLVQERVKEWGGVAFPGGKVNLGESIVHSVKREIKEETGLEIVNLEICGIKDWYDYDKEERQLIFLFTTSEFYGDLLPETDEGKNYWIEEEKIIDLEIAEDFEKLLEVFNDKNKNEMIYIEKNNKWYVELY